VPDSKEEFSAEYVDVVAASSCSTAWRAVAKLLSEVASGGKIISRSAAPLPTSVALSEGL